MEKYTKPVMEVEFFGRDIIATSGTGNYPLSTAISMLKSVVSVILLAGANGFSKLVRGEGFI